MPFPTREEVIATFSETENRRLRFLTWGQKASFYATSIVFLAAPFAPIPASLTEETGITYTILKNLPVAAVAVNVVANQATSYFEKKNEHVSMLFRKASKAALALAIVSPAILAPHATAETLAIISGVGLVGGYFQNAPATGAADQVAMFKIRDFVLNPLSPRQSLWEGIKVGAWHNNALKYSASIMATAGILGVIGGVKFYTFAREKIVTRLKNSRASNNINNNPPGPGNG